MNGGADDKRQRRIFAAFTAVTVFAALFTAAALGLIVSPLITKAYSYAVYALSAAFLLAAAGFFFICKKDILAAGKQAFSPAFQKLKNLPLIGGFFGDYAEKTFFSSLLTSLFNLVYLSYLIWMAAAYLSAWYASMAGFYCFLFLARSLILATEKIYAKKSGESSAPYAVKCKIFIGAGAANIVGGAVMSAPIIMMAVGNFPPGATVFNIVVNALFALIKIVSAIMTTVHGARSGDFTARALRNFGLTTALMSLQMLEMTIVGYTTGGDTMWLMVAVIGGIADGVTIFAGIYMMIRGALALKRAEKAGKTA